jgi:hypothetical protein
MYRFNGRGHGFSIWLRPAKVAWHSLKKRFDLLALDGALDEFVLPLVRFWIGRIGMMCGHGNLIADIVGEFPR